MRYEGVGAYGPFGNAQGATLDGGLHQPRSDEEFARGDPISRSSQAESHSTQGGKHFSAISSDLTRSNLEAKPRSP